MAGDEGMTLARTLAETLTSREALLEKEASVLFRYLLGKLADDPMIRLYVEAVNKRSSEKRPLRLPPLVTWRPALLRLFEPVKTTGADGEESLLKQRLRLACFIADSERAPLFYDYEGAGWARSSGSMAYVVILEGLIMPLRLVLGRWWRW